MREYRIPVIITIFLLVGTIPLIWNSRDDGGLTAIILFGTVFDLAIFWAIWRAVVRRRQKRRSGEIPGGRAGGRDELEPDPDEGDPDQERPDLADGQWEGLEEEPDLTEEERQRRNKLLLEFIKREGALLEQVEPAEPPFGCDYRGDVSRAFDYPCLKWIRVREGTPDPAQAADDCAEWIRHCREFERENQVGYIYGKCAVAILLGREDRILLNYEWLRGLEEDGIFLRQIAGENQVYDFWENKVLEPLF